MTHLPYSNLQINESHLNIDPKKRRYDALIGTGGIGAGSLFLLRGNHTLGREESRGGKYLDARDYCKLHIIEHYVKVFTGPDFPVFAIGKIGDDDVGRRIYQEMKDVGLNVDYVHTSPGDKTLFGFCFLYPDGTGGNLTTDESACSNVDPALIREAGPVFSAYANRFMALSAPEVPLDARKELLQLTRRFGGFAVASFTAGEIAEAARLGMLSLVDLIAINIEEAAALADVKADRDEPLPVVEAVLPKLKEQNPHMWASVTAGKLGSWSWDGKALTHTGGFSAEVKSSAGAGDAHIAGIMSGLIAGLTLQQAQVLANLAASYSVTSAHTIHPDMSCANILAPIHHLKKDIDPDVRKLLNAL